MLLKNPPMGWNTWNTFAEHISDQLIRETVDMMVTEGYRNAGYEYIVIDDCWSLRERGKDGELIADPEKFPYGMKALADYVHSKGFKFGMYSCAGVRTCAGYPGSYDHEYQDARTFASWGVDYLKYDFCFFPNRADCKLRYLMMSQALRATGRDIVFSACNWGVEEPWTWMRSVGAHLYRSTSDIFDTFRDTANIIKQQYDKFNMNAPNCYNDIDMMTVGMYGQGHVGGQEDFNNYEEYVTQFAFWCYFNAPLMMGADLRKLNEMTGDKDTDELRKKTKALLQNKALIELNQDEEQRPPFLVRREGDKFTFVKEVNNNEFVIGVFNLNDTQQLTDILLTDCGMPVSSGVAVEAYDILEEKPLGTFVDDLTVTPMKHGCKLIRCRFVPRNGFDGNRLAD